MIHRRDSQPFGCFIIGFSSYSAVYNLWFQKNIYIIFVTKAIEGRPHYVSPSQWEVQIMKWTLLRRNSLRFPATVILQIFI